MLEASSKTWFCRRVRGTSSGPIERHAKESSFQLLIHREPSLTFEVVLTQTEHVRRDSTLPRG